MISLKRPIVNVGNFHRRFQRFLSAVTFQFLDTVCNTTFNRIVSHISFLRDSLFPLILSWISLN